jgi:putative ATPase
MKPLAYRLRPKEFSEVYGQDHLVGENGIIRAMLKKKLFSFILHGNPGTGKTTIALITAEKSGLDYYHFNASTDNKARLMEIIETTTYRDILIIIDEIHRMKTDIQDYLLPYLENGKVIIIGITTLNPYSSVNKAIRSRCHIYKVLDIETDSILKALKGATHSDELDYDGEIDLDVLSYISKVSNNEIRTALNNLEMITIYGAKQDKINLAIAKRALGDKSLSLDDGNDYYDILSAFQKSLRGSDVQASLHYLSRLILLEDMDSIIRRLLVTVYEDVGLANPNLGPRVLAACETAKKVGFPEARIPLSVAVIETALSPKSNTAITAIDKAISRYKSGVVGPIPDHILNREIAKNPEIYKYPHNYKHAVVYQQYLPNNIIDDVYYEPKEESSYEIALKKRIELLKNIK